MSDAKPPLLHRLLKIGGIAALVVAAAVWGVKAYLAGQVTTAIIISPHDPAAVNVNKGLFAAESDGATPEERRDLVIGIYGTESGEQEELLFIDETKIIRPVELPELVLMPKGGSENLLQMQTVNLLTPWVSIGAGITGLLMLGLLAFLRKRRNASAA